MSLAKIIPATVVLGGAVVGLGSTILQAVLPVPVPVTIHALSYQAGIVRMERTVTSADAVALLAWSAQLIDDATGEPVFGCTGSGSWPFEVGRREVSVTLDRWVNSPTCTASVGAGTYHLRAAYSWGDEFVYARSEPFEVSQ